MDAIFRLYVIINRGGTATNLDRTKPSIKTIGRKLEFTCHVMSRGSRDSHQKENPTYSSCSIAYK